MDKLIFSRPCRSTQTDKAPVIRISSEAYTLIGEIVSETGLSMSYVASKMIEYAAEHTEIVDEAAN